jgi:hypothetical protein
MFVGLHLGLGGTVDLQVAETDLEKALELLEHYEAERSDKQEADDEGPALSDDPAVPLPEYIRPRRFSNSGSSDIVASDPSPPDISTEPGTPSLGGRSAVPTWTCAACGAEVDMEQSRCDACGTPFDPAEAAEEVQRGTAVVREKRSTIHVADDIVDDEALQDIVGISDDDVRASRALLFALLSICLPIIAAYSLMLVLPLMAKGEHLSKKGKWTMYAAFLISVTTLSLLCVVLFSRLARLLLD